MYKCNDFLVLNVSSNKIANYENSQSFKKNLRFYYDHNKSLPISSIKTCNEINYPDNLNK